MTWAHGSADSRKYVLRDAKEFVGDDMSKWKINKNNLKGEIV